MKNSNTKLFLLLIFCHWSHIFKNIFNYLQSLLIDQFICIFDPTVDAVFFGVQRNRYIKSTAVLTISSLKINKNLKQLNQANIVVNFSH